MKGFITNIQRMSIHDGPGIRSTIFLKGCNLRCKWCHNPETWSMKPQLQYIEDKCIHCFSCITVCEYEVLFIDSNRLSIHRERCTDCGNAQSAALRAHCPGLGKKLILRTSYMKFSRTLFTIRNPEEELPSQGVNLCSKKILR